MGKLRVAVDLGAGSGRVFVGRLGQDRVVLTEVHRFHYEPRPEDGHLRWDAPALFAGLTEGLRRAAAFADTAGLASVGVDSWGVDYGLIDAEGRRLEAPVCYRDERTRGVMDDVFAIVPRAELFARTGIQSMPLNTLYQLVAHGREGLPAEATRLLLIPDLCHHFLCGAVTTERTNASTTQMVSVHTGVWDESLLSSLGLPAGLLPEIVPTGTPLGHLDRAGLALDGVEVIAPATHDTASAVAGTPLEPGWAYISSGTWSLVVNA